MVFVNGRLYWRGLSVRVSRLLLLRRWRCLGVRVGRLLLLRRSRTPGPARSPPAGMGSHLLRGWDWGEGEGVGVGPLIHEPFLLEHSEGDCAFES